MIKAVVVGPIWATKRIDAFPAGALLEVEEIGTGRHFVTLDQLGAGAGEVVLIACGAGVSQHLSGRAPVDALVVGVIDETTTRSPERPAPAN